MGSQTPIPVTTPDRDSVSCEAELLRKHTPFRPPITKNAMKHQNMRATTIMRLFRSFPFFSPSSFSHKKLPLSPSLAVALGVLSSIALTILTSLLILSFTGSQVSLWLPQLSNSQLPSNQRFLSSSLSSNEFAEKNRPIVVASLARYFDIASSLSNKLPTSQQFKLLTMLQNSQSERKRPPHRIFVLHVVGSVVSSRLEAIASAITYVRNTNRFLLILWDIERGGESFGAEPLSSLRNDNYQYIMLSYVRNLQLAPNTSDFSEFQINYYTKFGLGGYHLDSVAAVSTRHIFYRAEKKVEGRYAAVGSGVHVMYKMFKPSESLQPAWDSYMKDWTFPHLSSFGVQDALNRVYAVPLIFVDNMSDFAKRRLLRELARSKSKRAFFIHAQYGLGNRLRALGSAMAIAKITGRVLVLIWEPDVHLNCRFSDLFANEIITLQKLNMNWPPGDANTKDPAMRMVDFYNFMRFNGKHIHNPQTELINPRSSRHVYVKTAYVVRSSFTPRILSTKSKYWKTMREELVPNAEIMYLVQDPSFVNIKKLVGVHIRSRTIEKDIKGVSEEFYGNSSRITDHWRRLTGLKTFEAKIMRLNVRYKFFVAADTREAITELERKFGSHRIFSIPRDEDCVTRDAECAKLALADILLLSKVPTLLGSHWSSFTEGAERMSGKVKVLEAGVHFGRPK